MHARSTTFEASPDRIDAGIAYFLDEVMPALATMDGYVGMSLLTHRESGRCILTTAWEDSTAMQSSAELIRPLRDRAAEVLQASLSVDEWQLAAVHRDHHSREGARVRATWLKVRPDQFDRAVEFYKTSVLPEIEQLEGFCSSSLMSDRGSGRVVVSVTYDSQDAVERTREQARSLRTSLLRDLGADQQDVGEFELVIANLRVPEMA